MKKKLHEDVYVALFLYLVLGFFLSMAMGYPKQSKIFPVILLTAMLLLNTVILVKGFKKSGLDNTLTVAGLKAPMLMYGLFVIYIVMFRFTNYFIATTFLLAASMLIFKIRNWKVILGVTLGFNLFIYLLFVLQLKVPII